MTESNNNITITKYDNIVDTHFDTLLEGIIPDNIDNNRIFYYAASPADYRTTFTGSGLPFHSKSQAFYETPNIGNQQLIQNKFSIKLQKPNAYYDNLAGPIVDPCLYLYYFINNIKKEMMIPLKERIPFRDIRFTDYRHNVEFYNNQNLPIRTQEQVLLDSKYPQTNSMPDNFWGSKPAM
jgi:hypothetical protein